MAIKLMCDYLDLCGRTRALHRPRHLHLPSYSIPNRYASPSGRDIKTYMSDVLYKASYHVRRITDDIRNDWKAFFSLAPVQLKFVANLLVITYFMIRFVINL